MAPKLGRYDDDVILVWNSGVETSRSRTTAPPAILP